jgi:hypothetical protein
MVTKIWQAVDVEKIEEGRLCERMFIPVVLALTKDILGNGPGLDLSCGDTASVESLKTLMEQKLVALLACGPPTDLTASSTEKQRQEEVTPAQQAQSLSDDDFGNTRPGTTPHLESFNRISRPPDATEQAGKLHELPHGCRPANFPLPSRTLPTPWRNNPLKRPHDTVGTCEEPYKSSGRAHHLLQSTISIPGGNQYQPPY